MPCSENRPAFRARKITSPAVHLLLECLPGRKYRPVSVRSQESAFARRKREGIEKAVGVVADLEERFRFEAFGRENADGGRRVLATEHVENVEE
jgi:hypothetical protein